MEVKIESPISDDWAEDEVKLWQAIFDYLEKKCKDPLAIASNALHSSDILNIAEKVGLEEFVKDYFSEYLWSVDAYVSYSDLEKGYENKSYIDKDLIEGFIVTTAWTESPYSSIWESDNDLEIIIDKRDFDKEAKAKVEWIAEQKKKYDNDFEKFAAAMYEERMED